MESNPFGEPISDVVVDQLYQLVEEAWREVVAHARNCDVAGAWDRVGGRPTAAGMDDQTRGRRGRRG